MLHSTKRHCKVLAVVTSLVLLASPASATYWSLFNEEGSSSGDPNIVTYDTLTDMLGDINRTGVFTPNPFGFGRNIVGVGADFQRVSISTIPEPSTMGLFGLGFAILCILWRRRAT